MPKTYRFFFHYNKPASKAAGKPQLTLHHKKVCHIVDAIQCDVPCGSKINKTQPHVVIAGNCASLAIEVKNGLLTAIIS
jgi:hypothetical protein